MVGSADDEPPKMAGKDMDLDAGGITLRRSTPVLDKL
jgi:hypothetical protein